MKKKQPPKLKPHATSNAPARHKVGQMIEVTISSLDDEGYGVGLVDKSVFYVAGTLENETVLAKVTAVVRKGIYASVVKVLRRSPLRPARPVCIDSITCEGCMLIQMSYPAQLRWKGKLVSDSMHLYGSLAAAEIHPVIPSGKPLNYRNSAKLVVAGKFIAPVIGIYRRNSHDVIDISNCHIHHPLINTVVQATAEGIKKGKVPIYSPRTESGLLRYLIVRVSEQTGHAMVVFVTSSRSYNEIHHLAKFLQSRVPEVKVVAQNVNSSTGNVILGDKDIFLTKEQSLNDSVGSTSFSISPRSFFQVNNSGARIIYEKVLEWSALKGTETVIDLYCGIGGISLFLAPHAKKVFGFEVVEAAVSDARSNARLNGINNCEFESGDAAKLLEEVSEEGKQVNLLVLNPPRKGCDPRVLEEAASISPEKIIYVSCSPKTLARDLDILATKGYETREIQPVDMFPQTPHVENVALLVKKSALSG